MGHEPTEPMLESIQLKNEVVSAATGWSYSMGVMLGEAGVWVVDDGHYLFHSTGAFKLFLGGGKELSKKQVQFSSDLQSCPTLCDPMDCSMSGLPVYLPL